MAVRRAGFSSTERLIVWFAESRRVSQTSSPESQLLVGEILERSLIEMQIGHFQAFEPYAAHPGRPSHVRRKMPEGGGSNKCGPRTLCAGHRSRVGLGKTTNGGVQRVSSARRTSPPRVGQRDDLHTRPACGTPRVRPTHIWAARSEVSFSNWYVPKIPCPCRFRALRRLGGSLPPQDASMRLPFQPEHPIDETR